MRFTLILSALMLVSGAASAASLEDFANQVSPLKHTDMSSYKKSVNSDVVSSPLSEYAQEVGIDVSKLSARQRLDMSSDYGDKPSLSFCDGHEHLTSN